MNRRNVLSLSTLTALGIALLPGNSIAQQAGDIEGVKAASKAFYTALTAVDGGAAMAKVWAQTPYITYVGPRDKNITVGWDAQKAMWPGIDALFTKRTVSLGQQFIHANGGLAWEMGNESGELVAKSGPTVKIDNIVTNVYEKQADGRWLMVSHHVQPKPQ
jgi:ketosteroid isomerase-like protein